MFDFKIDSYIEKLIAWAKERLPDVPWTPYNWSIRVHFYDDSDFHITLFHRATERLIGPWKKATKDVTYCFGYRKSDDKFWFAKKPG